MKKYLLALLLCSPLSYAGGSEDVKTLEVKLASLQMAEAVNNLSTKIKECNKQKKALKPELFNGLKLDNKELFTALLYFQFKNDIQCTKLEDGQFVLASTVMANTFKGSEKLPEEFKSDKLDELHTLVSDKYKQLLNLKARYKLLDEGKRKAIEQVQELNQGFDAVKTYGLLEDSKK